METVGGTSTERPVLGDRYELAEEVGRGATGIVWEAWDRKAARVVAVKILHPHLLTSELSRKRFLREVELASTLRHPNCVAVLDHGYAADHCDAYLVMERLRGATLAHRLRQAGLLPQPEAVRIVAQVLEGVGAAHAAQIVHRDLKPANVMLVDLDGERDVAKVCDFGLAKAIAPEGSIYESQGQALTDPGSIVTGRGDVCGTPEYMAPEQARGEAVDARADLYSIAVILYQALVGRTPFRARSALAVASMHLTAAPPSLRELRPDLEIYPPLENLILRALSKDPAERPSSAQVFRADLLQIARDHARRNRRPSGPSRINAHDGGPLPATVQALSATGGPLRGWRARAAAVGMIGLALVGGLLLGRRLRSTGVARQPEPSSSAARQSESKMIAALAAPSAADTATSALATTLPPVSPPTRTAAQAAPPRRLPGVPRTGKLPRRDSAIDPTLRTAAPLPAAEERLAAGQIAEACALGQSAVGGDPTSPEKWQFLGRCRLRLGERREAVAAFRRYLDLAPTATDAAFIRAIVEENQEANQEATQ